MDNDQTPKREKRSYSSLQSQLLRQIKFLENSCALFDNGDEDEAVRLATTLRVLLHDSDNPKATSKSLLKQLEIKDNLLFVDTGVYPDKIIEAKNQYLASLGCLKNGDWVNSYKITGTEILVLSRTDKDEIMKVRIYENTEVGLLVLSVNDTDDYKWIAPLDTPKIDPSSPFYSALQSPQGFKTWWETPLIQGQTQIISRKELIGIMCDQDGGAHVDPSLDKNYSDLTYNDFGYKWVIGDDIPDMTMTNDYDHLWQSAKSNIAAASVRQIAYEVLKTLKNYLADTSVDS